MRPINANELHKEGKACIEYPSDGVIWVCNFPSCELFLRIIDGMDRVKKAGLNSTEPVPTRGMEGRPLPTIKLFP